MKSLKYSMHFDIHTLNMCFKNHNLIRMVPIYFIELIMIKNHKTLNVTSLPK